MRGISLVTPYNGRADLELFLLSIEKQDLQRIVLEVVVVSEYAFQIGYTGRIAMKHKSLDIQFVNFERQDNFDGTAVGILKNLGAKAARYDQLVFIDSDCVLPPSCLKSFYRLYDQLGEPVICGSFLEISRPNWKTIQAEDYDSWFHEDMIQTLCLKDYRDKTGHGFEFRNSSWDEMYGGCFSVSRKDFMTTGGFDESGFRCQDIELGVRFEKLGLSIIYSPQCGVIHIEHYRSIFYRKNQINGWKLIQRKHPELFSEVRDRIVNCEKAFIHTLRECTIMFQTLTVRLMGYQVARFNWIIPNYDQQSGMTALQDLLKRIPHDSKGHPGGTAYRLRLKRDCWDFRIVVTDVFDLENPKISVLIPVFNGQATVKRAIESVLIQEYQFFELIIINDGSSDGSLDLVHSYSNNDPRVTVVSINQNEGLSQALNLGLEIANSDLIIQLDCDDEFREGVLKKVVDQFESYPEVGAIYGNPGHKNKGFDLANSGRQVSGPIEFLEYEYSPHPKAFRRSVLLEVGGWDVSDGFNGRYFDDKRILSKVSEVTFVKYIVDNIYHQNYRPNSLMNWDINQNHNVAKRAILWGEANRLGKNLSFSRRGKLLQPHFRAHLSRDSDVPFSVIIPTHNQNDMLEYTICSWLQSDFIRNYENELLIIDNGSEEPVQDSLSIDHPQIVIVRLNKNLGPAKARNVGVERSRHNLIMFSDADQLVPPHILSAHGHCHKIQKNRSIILGNVHARKTFSRFLPSKIDRQIRSQFLRLIRFSEKFEYYVEQILKDNLIEVLASNIPNLYTEAIKFSFVEEWKQDRLRVLHKTSGDLRGYPFRFLWVVTSNFSCHKEVYKAVGGFDENNMHMEDWEWGIRLQKLNIPVLCLPDAEVLHQVHPRHPLTKSKGQQKKSFELIHKVHGAFLKEIEREECDFPIPNEFKRINSRTELNFPIESAHLDLNQVALFLHITHLESQFEELILPCAKKGLVSALLLEISEFYGNEDRITQIANCGVQIGLVLSKSIKYNLLANAELENFLKKLIALHASISMVLSPVKFTEIGESRIASIQAEILPLDKCHIIGHKAITKSLFLSELCLIPKDSHTVLIQPNTLAETHVVDCLQIFNSAIRG